MRKRETLKESLLNMFKEGGLYSINRVLAAILFALSNFGFWIVVLVMFIGGVVFNGFGELTTVYISIQTLIAGWLTGNKFTNSKYNTERGFLGKPLSPEEEHVYETVTGNKRQGIPSSTCRDE